MPEKLPAEGCDYVGVDRGAAEQGGKAGAFVGAVAVAFKVRLGGISWT